ncbi:MAG TPA: carbohydrate binding domain-containing protein, partial [Paenibacillus sp.]|nr:carbohydrate binding domain-containing protein [Paenibacillus sp.]
PDGSVRPDQPVTRAEFVALLNRMFGFTSSAQVDYKDVSGEEWFSGDVMKAHSSGLVNGYPDGTFRPSAPITRQDAVTVLARAFQLNAEAAGAAGFSDEASVGDYALQAVRRFAEEGYVQGDEGNAFEPHQPLTRAQKAAMLDRLVDGWASEAGEWSGDAAAHVVVKAPGAVLKDVAIEGNLYLTEGIGDGEVTLENVVVEGTTYVSGGGMNSIVVVDSTLGDVAVSRKDGKVRIVASGSTTVASVSLVTGGKLEEADLTGDGFRTVTVSADEEIELIGDFDDVTIEADSAVTVSGNVKNVAVNGANASLNGEKVEQGAKVKVENGGKPIPATPPAQTPAPAPSGSGGDGPQPSAPPALTADTTENWVGHDMRLTFPDNASWRGAISAVRVNGAALPAQQYRVAAGAITVKADAFASAKTYAIRVDASGYAPATVAQPVVNATEPGDWELVWSDEFDGTGPNLSEGGVNLDKWGFQNGTGAEYGLDGWGNNEQQYYTDDNVKVEDGKLVIEAKPQVVGNKKYTSGRLYTANTFAKTYGKFEARMKLPVGEGFWPAFWMMPKDSEYGVWAASGELDIMEARGRLPDHVGGTIHHGGTWPNNRYTGKEYHFPEGESIEEFHTYGVEWEPGEIRWYVDGKLYQTLNNWDSIGNGQPTHFAYPAPFDKEFYMILNLAVGGTYDGNREPSPSDFPAKMEVDYVRVYELEGRPYREPVAPTIEPEQLPAGAKQANSGNYVYDVAFERPIRVISAEGQALDTQYWNFAKISTFGGDGSASVESIDGKPFAKIDITNGGSQPHSIQLIQNITLAKGRYYKLSFDAKAAVDRSMTVKIGGGAERGYASYSGSKTVALTNAVQSYSYKFQMQAESDALARLEFNMGTNAEDVWIGNVRVEESDSDLLNENGAKEPLENGNHVYNGSFNLGHAHRMTYWNFASAAAAQATAAVDAEANRLHVDVADGGAAAGDITLVQKGIQLLQKDTYELTFEAAAAAARSIEVALVGADGATNYTGYRTVALTTSMATHKETFTMPVGVADANAQLVFRFGGNDADVYLTNVSIVRTTNHNVDYSGIDLFPLKNGDFSLGLTAWTPFVQGGAATFAEDGGLAKVAVTSVGGEVWNVMLMQEAMKFTKGMEYVIGFDVRSTANRTIEAVLENAAYTRIFQTGAIDATPTTKRYEYSFKMGANETLALKFLLGKTSVAPAGAHDIFIDNVVLELKNPPVKRAPTLVPDTTLNQVGQPVEIRFADNAEWRAAVTAVKVNGAAIASGAYSLGAGQLTLHASNFTQGIAYAVTVEAEGYAPAAVTQPMVAPDGNLVMNGSFAAGQLNWQHWAGDGGASTFHVTDGVAAVEVTNNGGLHWEWNIPVTWSTQLSQSNIELKAGKTYELSFTARATAA